MSYPCARVYDTKEMAESAARFIKGVVFPLSSLKPEHFVRENKTNTAGFVIIQPLPDYLMEKI